MIGSRMITRLGMSDEGEKPFWISFADLMTALMVLFMVIMVIALLSVTAQMRAVAQKGEERERDIKEIMKDLVADSAEFPGVSVNSERMTISFGEKARFQSGHHELSDEAQSVIRKFVADKILVASNTAKGRKWFKRVVVEGFTDTDGSYLFNLDLSLKRAQRVVCGLFAEPSAASALDASQQQRVREIFTVGGFSFNSAKLSKDESRRVELRIDFRALGEETISSNQDLAVNETGKCQLQ